MYRTLIHLVGDIHQPLHAVSRYTKAHPGGDAGGNLFYIKYNNIHNLHALWDAQVGLSDGGYPTPVNFFVCLQH